MPDPLNTGQQLKVLQETVRLLSLENETLAERTEDMALLGLITEKINCLLEPDAVIEAGLEQISLLKDIPFCACCTIADSEVHIVRSYMSFSQSELRSIRLSLPPDVMEMPSLLFSHDEIRSSGISMLLSDQVYEPSVLVVVPFKASTYPRGFFIFADAAKEAKLEHMLVMLRRVVELLTTRLDTLHLLRTLQEMNENLDRTVAERTAALTDTNRELEKEIAERVSTQEALQESERHYRELFNELRQADLARERSEKLLQAIIDTEPECVKLLDAEAKLIMMNRAGLNMLQVDSLDQVKGQCVCPLVTSKYREAFLELTRRVFEGNPGTLVFEMVGLKGGHLWLETHAVPFRNEKDEIVALLGITRDITEHRRLEEQLRQSQKMESIGTLAGGVAHDFNNILTAIIGYGHLTLMSMAPDDPVRLNIENMLEAAERAAHLTKDLLLFSRKQLIDRKPIDLNGIVRKLEMFLARVIGEDISFQTNLPAPELWVMADAHQLEQVLMNLATNARDAMPKGGTFTLTTGQVRLDEQFIALHGYGKPDLYALITVSDTGIGMDEETLKRIYEPFYTTKEVGKGTGLGLAVIYGIVRQHEGFIHAYSEPGLGTTFRIFLPLLASMQGEEQKQPQMASPARGTETVLLAEDNDVVRNLTETVLKDSGYTVISAVDGEDAVQKYREHKDRIQLLLFDLIMPKKGGKEAYDEIKEIKPDVKILFTSGYSPDIVRDKTTLGSLANIAYKPISPVDLLRKVRSVLDA